jgi:hypothetical protein
MGWLDDLRKWLETGETPAPGVGTAEPPTFTISPRPFGVGRDVAGVEWQTDKRTSGLVRYRPAGNGAWAEVVDESRQRDHQRTLPSLTPDTEYQVEVTATVPKRGGGMVSETISLRTLPAGHTPGEPPLDEPGQPGEPPGGVTPIPHPPMTVNVLAEHAVWLPRTLTQVDPAFAAWLRAYCLGGPTRLVLADLARVPDRMRQAGFRGRDNALWYTLSRSYAEWNWQLKPGDADSHLSDQRRELHDIWANYIDVVVSAMVAAPQTTVLILENDAVDRCGKTLGEYTQRQLRSVAGRVELGRFHPD